jgi:hypothetical protein
VWLTLEVSSPPERKSWLMGRGFQRGEMQMRLHARGVSQKRSPVTHLRGWQGSEPGDTVHEDDLLTNPGRRWARPWRLKGGDRLSCVADA